MFTPKWKKDAKLLLQGAKKFIDYKRDLLKPERIAEIDSRRADLLTAITAKDTAGVAECSKQLRMACENSLPREKPPTWLEENVEVMFVSIVIAFGVQAYFLKPFRIPTGSMQPTLNGITGKPLAEKDWPSFPKRMLEQVTRGRDYVKVVAEQDYQIATNSKGGVDIRDVPYLHFFSRSLLFFKNAPPLRLPAPASPCYEAGLRAAINLASQNGGVIPKGTVLCEGIIDTGDLVLVDKISYHFCKPQRGSVFVFNTIDNEGIQKRGGEQGAGSHYIKRLCGVPGDTLAIQSPNLFVNGKIAQEPGIQRVIRGEGIYKETISNGYSYAKDNDISNEGKPLPTYLTGPDTRLLLAADAPPGMREYAALGDNTNSSLDSRYWGSVKEFNLVGPALFSLWPFTTGHWGFID